MIKQGKRTSLTGNFISLIALVAIAYIGLIFTLPTSQATMDAYDISSLEYRIIMFAISIPSILVWIAAFVGYAELKQYARYIRKTAEGPNFSQLATGCGWLAWSLPFVTIATLLLNGIANKWPGFHSWSIIINNYLSIILPLIAFTIIGMASRSLVMSAKIRFSLRNVRTILGIFLVAGVVYCYAILQHFQLSSLTSTNNAYFLPAWLMVLTVIMPYLYVWFVGMLAAYEINLYSKRTHGVLYKQSLRLVVWGFTAVIASIIALQYLYSIQPRVGHLLIDGRLMLTIVFRLVGGIGFILLAIGANQLKKIEEV